MSHVNTKQFSGPMEEALRIANGITPSVLGLAVALKVKPGDFAKSLNGDGEEVSLYRSKVATSLQTLLVQRAIDEAKEDKQKEAEDED